MKSNSKFIFLICSIYIVFLFTRCAFPETIITLKLRINDKISLNASKEKYRLECVELYKKLRNPDTRYVFDPPVKQIPNELMNEFTENGTVKIEYIYYNDLFKDSASNDKSKINRIITKNDLDYWIGKVNRNEPLGYDDKELRNIMFKMSSSLKNKTMAVIGTISVWVEAISLAVGCSKITTLDYTRNKYEQPQLEWKHVNDYYDEAIKNSVFETFDNAASFSSLEHAGLGRFGDPLSPNGDIDAVKQVHCMLKKGGLFFLAIPVSLDDKYMISFNGGTK